VDNSRLLRLHLDAPAVRQDNMRQLEHHLALTAVVDNSRLLRLHLDALIACREHTHKALEMHNVLTVNREHTRPIGKRRCAATVCQDITRRYPGQEDV
jgi:hypothetical protein